MEIKTKTTTYIFKDEPTLEDMENVGLPDQDYKGIGIQKIFDELKIAEVFDADGKIVPAKITDEIKAKLDKIDGSALIRSHDSMTRWNHRFIKAMLETPKTDVGKLKLSEYNAIITHANYKKLTEVYFNPKLGESPQQ